MRKNKKNQWIRFNHDNDDDNDDDGNENENENENGNGNGNENISKSKMITTSTAAINAFECWMTEQTVMELWNYVRSAFKRKRERERIDSTVKARSTVNRQFKVFVVENLR